jgi:phage-related protein
MLEGVRLEEGYGRRLAAGENNFQEEYGLALSITEAWLQARFSISGVLL